VANAPRRLGREERLEQVGLTDASMPTPSSETSIAALAAVGSGAPPFEAAARVTATRTSAAGGDGIGGVGDQVHHDHALERPASPRIHTGSFGATTSSRRRRHQRREARRQARHELRQIETLQCDRLRPPAVSSSLDSRAALITTSPMSASAARASPSFPAMPLSTWQRIVEAVVEVVGEAARQPSDRVEPLGALEALGQLPAFADVHRARHQPATQPALHCSSTADWRGAPVCSCRPRRPGVRRGGSASSIDTTPCGTSIDGQLAGPWIALRVVGRERERGLERRQVAGHDDTGRGRSCGPRRAHEEVEGRWPCDPAELPHADALHFQQVRGALDDPLDGLVEVPESERSSSR
jgi:hypothetical protein